jgi:hypothetical protein
VLYDTSTSFFVVLCGRTCLFSSSRARLGHISHLSRLNLMTDFKNLVGDFGGCKYALLRLLVRAQGIEPCSAASTPLMMNYPAQPCNMHDTQVERICCALCIYRPFRCADLARIQAASKLDDAPYASSISVRDISVRSDTASRMSERTN